MKNTKELQPILTALFALNQTSDHKDKNIALILDYAFRTFFGANTNLLTLACIGRTYEEMLTEVKTLLNEDTQMKRYFKEYFEEVAK